MLDLHTELTAAPGGCSPSTDGCPLEQRNNQLQENHAAPVLHGAGSSADADGIARWSDNSLHPTGESQPVGAVEMGAHPHSGDREVHGYRESDPAVISPVSAGSVALCRWFTLAFVVRVNQATGLAPTGIIDGR